MIVVGVGVLWPHPESAIDPARTDNRHIFDVFMIPLSLVDRGNGRKTDATQLRAFWRECWRVMNIDHRPVNWAGIKQV